MLEGYTDLLTTDEVCEILHISRNSLYPLLQSKKIRGFHQGRIWKVPKKSVEDYIVAMAELH
ncbi:MAG: helix-turn-helix domain-containing protein [Clostridiales bacterium]|nr:helix-turn-helix domain-containing protein [Clostridiales bacterium]